MVRTRLTGAEEAIAVNVGPVPGPIAPGWQVLGELANDLRDDIGVSLTLAYAVELSQSDYQYASLFPCYLAVGIDCPLASTVGGVRNHWKGLYDSTGPPTVVVMTLRVITIHLRRRHLEDRLTACLTGSVDYLHRYQYADLESLERT